MSVLEDFYEDLLEIIADNPTTATIRGDRKTSATGPKSVRTVTGFACRIDPFRHNTTPIDYNEKGTTSTFSHLFACQASLITNIGSGATLFDKPEIGDEVLCGVDRFLVSTVDLTEGIYILGLNKRQ